MSYDTDSQDAYVKSHMATGAEAVYLDTMNLEDDFRSRINEVLIRDFSDNLSAFAAKAEVDRGNLYKFLQKQRRSVTLETFEKIARIIGWEVSRHPPRLPGSQSHGASKPQALSEYEFVPMVEASASAGNGSMEDSGAILQELAFRRDWLVTKTTHLKSLRVWRVKGDSMEPVISEGSVVLIDEADTTPQKGRVYVARMDGEQFIKEFGGKDAGSDYWISANPVYKPIQIQAHQDYAVIGRVLWSAKEF